MATIREEAEVLIKIIEEEAQKVTGIACGLFSNLYL